MFYATIFFADADGMTSLDIFTLGYFVHHIRRTLSIARSAFR